MHNIISLCILVVTSMSFLCSIWIHTIYASLKGKLHKNIISITKPTKDYDFIVRYEFYARYKFISCVTLPMYRNIICSR